MPRLRLNKVLAQAGLTSRRGAERLINEGRVAINGTVVRELATLADPTLDPSRQWIQIHLDRPRDIPRVELLPYQPAARALQVISVNGRPFTVHPGWNDLPVGLLGPGDDSDAADGSRLRHLGREEEQDG